MNKKILIGSIITVVILALSSLGVIAHTSEETPFASSESSEVIGNLPRWEEEIRYYDPDTIHAIVVIHTCYLPCFAIRLTQDELSAYSGWNLTKVRFKVSCEGFGELWARLKIYGEGTATQPGSIIYKETDLFFDATGFHIIEIDTPIALDDHEEIWIGIQWEIFASDFFEVPVFVDDGPAVQGKGDWVFWGNGDDWEELGTRNWVIGAIVEGEDTELIIDNIKGPIGVNAEVKNIGEIDAINLEYTMTVTGGILGMINKTVNGNKTILAMGETVPINSGFILGLGPISITVTADADNAYEDSISKTGFILGPFVFLG